MDVETHLQERAADYTAYGAVTDTRFDSICHRLWVLKSMEKPFDVCGTDERGGSL